MAKSIIKISGDAWLNPPINDGKAWCRLIMASRDLDLTKTNGYAIKAGFIPFNKKISIMPGCFFVVASQNRTNPYKRRDSALFYTYKLIRCGLRHDENMPEDSVCSEVSKDTYRRAGLFLTSYAENFGIVPNAPQVTNNNSLYQIAQYCWLHYAWQRLNQDMPLDTVLFSCTNEELPPVEVVIPERPKYIYQRRQKRRRIQGLDDAQN